MTQVVSGDLVRWFNGTVRSFLVEHAPDRVEQLDADVRRLTDAAKVSGEPVPICFLGMSGVGKSTLVNALVAGKDVILPAGGTGPLTALAIRVRHAQTPRFSVRYHGAQMFWRVAAGLEFDHVRRLRAEGKPLRAEEPVDLLDRLDGPERSDLEGALAPPESAEGTPERTSRRASVEGLERQARLMVCGSQDATVERTYLIDGLRAAAGTRLAWGSTIRAEDQPRVARLREALALASQGSPYVRSGVLSDRAFREDLRDHASGFLAPLIAEIEVGWPSELLAHGMEIVDLPGVGVASDVYQQVTEKWMAKHARAVVLVVDRAGVTKPCAELLHTSRFFNRLTYRNESSVDPVTLLVAVTRVDDVADEEHLSDPSREPHEHLALIRERQPTVVRGQLRSELERMDITGSTDATVRAKLEEVVREAVSTLQVHPLSAPEYRRTLAESARPRIVRDAEETGIPAFRKSLERVVTEYRTSLRVREDELAANLHARIVGLLQSIFAQWTEQSRAADDAERLQRELDEFVRPIRDELKVRQGKFHEFLESTMKDRIGALTDEALRIAEKDILKYMSPMQDYSWNTLAAAVRRGGAYEGSKHIQIPRELSLRCEAPLAAIWSEQILKGLRKRTKELATDTADLLEPLIAWAELHGAKVSAKTIEAQHASIRAHAGNIELVGKEMVDVLREKVKDDVFQVIEAVVKKACAKFVADGRNAGAGVKARILDLFRGLAERATAGARDPALRILESAFRDVRAQIGQAYRRFDDPLSEAVSAIVDSHEQRLRRSDAQRRKKVLSELEAIFAADLIGSAA